jgi:hypothetical protein
MIEEDTMNPMLNYWAVVERMQSLRAEAEAAARHAAGGHAAARARPPRRSRRELALVAGLGRGRPGTVRGRPGTVRGRPGTARGIVIKAGEAL